ncbi:MAG TPA: hypothetical protein VGF56_07685, partial [Rhizomicrobium sp.]
ATMTIQNPSGGQSPLTISLHPSSDSASTTALPAATKSCELLVQDTSPLPATTFVIARFMRATHFPKAKLDCPDAPSDSVARAMTDLWG